MPATSLQHPTSTSMGARSGMGTSASGETNPPGSESTNLGNGRQSWMTANSAVPSSSLSVPMQAAPPEHNPTVSQTLPTPADWTATTPHPGSATGMTANMPVLAPAPIASSMTGYPHVAIPSRAAAPAPTKTRRKASAASKATEKPTTANPRRQKRLERNRESARLSRRRRKQYLEVLEERVTQLSEEMDKGRREHVAASVHVLSDKRQEALDQGDLHSLETNLARTSLELRVTGTFQTQQLQSLSLPPQTKFLLWLTLQTDTFFRGGRSASERLSAARIGERMLCNGNDRVAPAQGMWPLFCNEIGLSFDQEERLRNFQKALLQSPTSWLHRHTGAASGLVLQSAHDAIQALHNRIGQREQAVSGVLTDSQRLHLLRWAAKNRDRIAEWNARRRAQRPTSPPEEYSLSKEYHDAANLYILNHRLQKVVHIIPECPCLVPQPALRRLARRPSFESLASSSSLGERSHREEGKGLSREVSFSSSGSLKRAASEIELDEERPMDRPLPQCISPEEAETAAQPTMDAALGSISLIVPARPAPPPPDQVPSSAMPPPNANPLMTPPVPAPLPAQYYPQSDGMMMQAMAPLHPHPGAVNPPIVYSNPAVVEEVAPLPSFLPPHLNAVPEDALLQGHSADGSDDFLFELTEEDWAIGVGLDMDTTG